MEELVARGKALRRQGHYEEGDAILNEAVEAGSSEAAWLVGDHWAGAQLDHPPCMMMVTHDAEGVPLTYEERRAWKAEAHRSGDPRVLAVHMDSQSRDWRQAQPYMEPWAEAGDPWAQWRLGCMIDDNDMWVLCTQLWARASKIALPVKPQQDHHTWS